ncbi:uncharacterized protein LOC123406271 [Hordeum vulgare subsp. vulgare]|uniref:Uncharacterized protein n=1 Tax=Hordeum vulgare subsp. vulgare TaxID=112509 RepID=A0A8I6XWZ1_HORVV|nr:uncharacterized protein LOC123406271 [Hordeum vulgare subsp. vulgare]XP_044955692.1 uncharacterized protein LOC123406271 [Hordeum vulgare subsp. vulgare]
MATTLKRMWGQVMDKKGEAVRELEVSVRAKGNVTQMEDALLRACTSFTNVSYTVTSAVITLVGAFASGQVHKVVGGQPMPRLFRLAFSAGAGLTAGRMMYYESLHATSLYILGNGEEHFERLKMELANIILTKHSDEKLSVEAVKKHFFAENFYTDQYQDKARFRWHPRYSYVDSTYLERVKEIEANNSVDKDNAMSVQTMGSFGNLMEDPLACILGSPDSDMENDKPPERTATIHRKRDLRARRRSQRHHRRHAAL